MQWNLDQWGPYDDNIENKLFVQTLELVTDTEGHRIKQRADYAAVITDKTWKLSRFVREFM